MLWTKYFHYRWKLPKFILILNVIWWRYSVDWMDFFKRSFHCRQSRNEIKLISFFMEKKICILILWASSVWMVKAHSTSTHGAVVCVCVCVHVNKTGCCLFFIFFCFTHFSVSLLVLFKWKMPVTVKIWCVLQIYIFFLFVVLCTIGLLWCFYFGLLFSSVICDCFTFLCSIERNIVPNR